MIRRTGHILFIASLITGGAMMVHPVMAEGITAKTDPVFTPMYENAPHPLEDLFFMARSGDGRAQFILADLYLKGKGGVLKNTEAAKSLLEHSAKNGEDPALARLATLAAAEGDKAQAYAWYTILQRQAKARDYKKWARHQIKTLGFTHDEREQAKDQVKHWTSTDLEPIYIPDSKAALSKTPAARPNDIEDTPSPNAHIKIAPEDGGEDKSTNKSNEIQSDTDPKQSVKESFND